ncbi:MAG: CoA-binding protein [Candidatus Iainarchaeum archaeon]|uniref:CoA-binding protein n=1 Tax=Candidatus Iainarchaeum sp. TaxID=3101447 RepID=A0A497JI03_9ARCH|nr:MAG: CoA-binding protein [Candidatus Diapherotrites archaeon]
MRYSKFLDKKNVVAVVGVSRNSKKWGYKIFKKLIDIGFNVYAVNPKYPEIAGVKCYPTIKSLPAKPDVVITAVPPKITEKIVKESKALGVKMVWMQPGSESEKAIAFCKENDIEVVYNACFVVTGLGANFNN